jgi:ferritin-like metal-binding protein YciE
MTLQQLLIEQMQDLYDAEHQLIVVIPRMAEAARGDALRMALLSHVDETRVHVNRLEEVFTHLGVVATRRNCVGIAGIVDESVRLLKHADIDGAVLDAGLIAGAQKAEHYEMCGYGTCVAWARTLGLHQVASRLEETLVEEKAADQTLNDLAVQEVNISATHEEA